MGRGYLGNKTVESRILGNKTVGEEDTREFAELTLRHARSVAASSFAEIVVDGRFALRAPVRRSAIARMALAAQAFPPRSTLRDHVQQFSFHRRVPTCRLTSPRRTCQPLL